MEIIIFLVLEVISRKYIPFAKRHPELAGISCFIVACIITFILELIFGIKLHVTGDGHRRGLLR